MENLTVTKANATGFYQYINQYKFEFLFSLFYTHYTQYYIFIQSDRKYCKFQIEYFQKKHVTNTFCTYFD